VVVVVVVAVAAAALVVVVAAVVVSRRRRSRWYSRGANFRHSSSIPRVGLMIMFPHIAAQAHMDPYHCLGVHVNFVWLTGFSPKRAAAVTTGPMTPQEEAWLRDMVRLRPYVRTPQQCTSEHNTSINELYRATAVATSWCSTGGACYAVVRKSRDACITCYFFALALALALPLCGGLEAWCRRIRR
jgi:hypothetical protein